MNKASGSLTLYKVRTGGNISLRLAISNGVLTQVVTDRGSGVTVAPDYTIEANQPKLTPMAAYNGDSSGLTFSDEQWEYNRSGSFTLLNFDDNGTCTTSGCSKLFKKVGSSLVIIGNIGSADNLNTDILKYTATITRDGIPYLCSTEQKIEIIKSSTSEYTLLVTLNDGSSTTLSSTNPKILLGATLLCGGVEISSSAYNNYIFKWFKDGESEPYSTGTRSYITMDDVNGQCLVICRAYSKTSPNVVLDGYGIVLDDIDDTYFIKLIAKDSSGNEISSDVAGDNNSDITVTASIQGPSEGVYAGFTLNAIWKMLKRRSDSLAQIGDAVTTEDTVKECSITVNNTTSTNDFIQKSVTNSSQNVAVDVIVEAIASNISI